MKQIVAVFERREDAQRGIAALEREGIPSTRVRLFEGEALPNVVGTFVALGVQPHHAIRYEWALHHGRTLLMTTVGAAKAARVARVLSLCHPVERVTAA